VVDYYQPAATPAPEALGAPATEAATAPARVG
jgi:hypothetical protein